MNEHHRTGTMQLVTDTFDEALVAIQTWLKENPLHTPQGLQVIYQQIPEEPNGSWAIYLRTMEHNT